MRTSRSFAALLLAASLSTAPSLRAQRVVADPALASGVRAMTNMAMDFLRSGGAPKPIP